MNAARTLMTASGLALVAGLAAGAAGAETWDMPVAYPGTNYHTQNAEAFAACVKTATSDAVDIVVHANGSLFAGNDIKRAVQTGQAPIGERLISAHANENPIFGLDSIPFLATSFDDSVKLWAAGLETMKSVLADQNLVYVYAVPWPPQGLYTKKDVNSAADLKGVKFRAYNAATAKIAELAGMVPVQIEAAELSQALATGVAESFVSSGSTGVDSKVWESLTHFYDVQAWLPRNMVFVNKDMFDGLDGAGQTAVLDCGAEAEERGLATARELTAGYLKTLADNGMTVADPSDQLKADLQGFGETMTADWIAAAGEQGQAIVDAYRAN
ncbi:TRAP transporter substrate-binding protein [Frigidibacter sp. MR17.24]|uniref:TRAP transporter substrate-binding protein n=1 Tax=Frigidibacter sp. MR17.24 TaxID=3127345 RepID=UPI003012F425